MRLEDRKGRKVVVIPVATIVIMLAIMMAVSLPAGAGILVMIGSASPSAIIPVIGVSMVILLGVAIAGLKLKL